MLKYLLYPFVFMAFLSCSDSCEDKKIIPNESELQGGDIVFRRGKGIESKAVLYADGGLFSHVGIVVEYQGRKMIIHSVPWEQEHKDDEDKIKMALKEKLLALNMIQTEVQTLL